MKYEQFEHNNGTFNRKIMHKPVRKREHCTINRYGKLRQASDLVCLLLTVAVGRVTAWDTTLMPLVTACSTTTSYSVRSRSNTDLVQ